MIIPLSEWDANGITVRTGDPPAKVVPAEVAGDERIVLDLHIGRVWYNPGPDVGQALEEGKPIRVKPGQALRFDTRESFVVGPHVFGQICSRASLTNRGLVVSNIKVDPLFHGKLGVTVFNVSSATVTIGAAEAFCSIFFQRVTTDVAGEWRVAPHAPARQVGRIRESWQRNRRSIVTTLIALVISVAGSLIATAAYDEGSSSPPPSTTSSHP